MYGYIHACMHSWIYRHVNLNVCTHDKRTIVIAKGPFWYCIYPCVIAVKHCNVCMCIFTYVYMHSYAHECTHAFRGHVRISMSARSRNQFQLGGGGSEGRFHWKPTLIYIDFIAHLSNLANDQIVLRSHFSLMWLRSSMMEPVFELLSETVCFEACILLS